MKISKYTNNISAVAVIVAARAILIAVVRVAETAIATEREPVILFIIIASEFIGLTYATAECYMLI